VTDGPFTRRGAIWLAALAAGSLAISAFLGVYGDLLGDPPSWGADGYSRSATGHRAFLELVRRLGFPVLSSRHRTADKAGGDVVVALLEPEAGPKGGAARARLAAIAGASRRLLLVLPKREGTPDPAHLGWLGRAALRPTDEVLAPLQALEGEAALGRALAATLVRPARTPGRWSGSLPTPAVDEPQLLRSPALEPLVWCEEGTLVGALEHQGGTVLVVADPDLLETHGLGRGDNALLLVRLLERLGAGGRALVVDETLHGLEVQPSIVRELLRFPLLLATLQALLVAALLAWAALVRFGRPVAPPAPAPGGPGQLVESAALLLAQGGYAAEALEGYFRAAREEVLRRLHRPGEGRDGDEALRRLLAARGREGELAALAARVRAVRQRRHGVEEEAVRAAREIHRWREELTDGAAGDP
jgi:hypothetical protein